MTWLLKGGRVVDPAAGVDGRMDLLIANGIIADAGDLSGAYRGRLSRGGLSGKGGRPGLIDTGARVWASRALSTGRPSDRRHGRRRPEDLPPCAPGRRRIRSSTIPRAFAS